MPSSLIRIAVGVTAAALPVATVFAAAALPSSTTDGVFTQEQAARGKQLYQARCAMCHGQNLEGTYEIVPLKGRFLANWQRAPLGRLVDYVGRTMPQMAPGSLQPDENAAVVAYILQENGMPAGGRSMPTDPAALDAVTIDSRPRARPGGKSE